MALFHRAILALTESRRENQGGIMRDEKGKKKKKQKKNLLLQGILSLGTLTT